ncbi:MAG: yqgP [Bacteroidetes bacterium]|nr:MAG: yqgP [Bacteroidota bacterium]
MNQQYDNNPHAAPPVPRDRPYVTFTLIGINVLMLLLLVLFEKTNPMLPDAEAVLRWGANNRYFVYNRGEWWRLVAHMFQHFGILHLAINMYALFQVGAVLELNFGRWRLVFFYLLAGFAGAFASNWFFEFAIGVGASGAIFGLFGALGALATTNLVRKEYRMSILKNLGFFLVINLAIGFQSGMIDNAAHIGGFIGGVLSAYGSYFALRFAHRPGAKASGVILPVILTGIFCFVLFMFTPPGKDPDAEINRLHQQVGKIEERTNIWLNDFDTRDSARPEDTALLDRAAAAFDSIMRLTDSMLAFKLTPHYDKRFRLYRLRVEEQNKLIRYQRTLLASQVPDSVATAKMFLFKQRIDSIDKAFGELLKQEPR